MPKQARETFAKVVHQCICTDSNEGTCPVVKSSTDRLTVGSLNDRHNFWTEEGFGAMLVKGF